MSQVRVRVVNGSENAVVTISSFVSFSNFVDWVRCRFGIENTTRIIFKDHDGDEVIPSFCNNVTGDNALKEIFIEVVSDTDKSKTEGFSAGRTAKYPPWKPVDFLSISFLYPVIILAYFLTAFTSYKAHVGPKHFFAYISPLFTSIRIAKEHQLKLYADMYAAFVTWPVTYFYIRRAMNPENGGLILSFRKYGSDAFYGALCATAVVILRHYIRNMIEN